MSFSTRCPQCHSVFRVDARQLVATAGMARCGVCGQPFNALEAHIPDTDPFTSEPHAPASEPHAPASEPHAPASEPHAPASEPHALAPEPLTASVTDFALHQHTLDDAPPQSPSELLPDSETLLGSVAEGAVEHTTSTATASQPDSPVAHASVAPAEDTDLDWMEIPPLSALYEPLPSRDAVAGDAVAGDAEPIAVPATVVVAEHAATAPVAMEAARPAAANLVTDPDSETSGAAVAAQTAGNGTAASPFATSRHHGTPWGLLSLSLLLALLLAGQVAWHERVRLAARLPALKPVLVSLCGGQPGCGARLPRDLDALRLTSTELSVDPVDAHRLHVRWSMANTADMALQFPDISLSLSSDGDQLLVRRNFAPGDYLPANQPAAAGIAPGSDMAAELVLDIGTLNVSNYKLLLAYPSRGPAG